MGGSVVGALRHKRRIIRMHTVQRCGPISGHRIGARSVIRRLYGYGITVLCTSFDGIEVRLEGVKELFVYRVHFGIFLLRLKDFDVREVQEEAVATQGRKAMRCEVGPATELRLPRWVRLNSCLEDVDS